MEAKAPVNELLNGAENTFELGVSAESRLWKVSGPMMANGTESAVAAEVIYKAATAGCGDTKQTTRRSCKKMRPLCEKANQPF